jgi:hypothetical protein
MARVQLRCQQTDCCDYWEIDFIRHGDKLRTLLRVEFRNRLVIPGIDRDDVCILVNNFGFVVAHSVDLVRDLVEVRLRHHDANQFVSAEFHSIALDLLRRPPLIGEWIEG